MSPINPFLSQIWIKLIYSEKATKFDEIFTLLLTGTTYIGLKKGGDFEKFCGLLRIYDFITLMTQAAHKHRINLSFLSSTWDI